MHAGSAVIHVTIAHCGGRVLSSPSPTMTQPSDVEGGEPLAAEPPAAMPPPPRISRIWLVLALIIITALGVLSGDAMVVDSWLLPAAGAALTLFSLVFAKTLDLAVKERLP